MSEKAKEEVLDNFLQGDDMWPSTKTNVKRAMDKWAEIQIAKLNSPTLKDENDALYIRINELSVLLEEERGKRG